MTRDWAVIVTVLVLLAVLAVVVILANPMTGPSGAPGVG
jgi:hypothetical protein